MVDVESPILSLLQQAVQHGASDLHLVVGSPPTMRVNGALQRLQGSRALTPVDMWRVFEAISDEGQQALFQQHKDLDFSYSVPGLSRVRVSVALQRGTIALAFRILPAQLPTVQSLGLPPIVAELACKPQGLLLITGPAGSGKTTTLAALVNHLNRNHALRILAVEDPIEYLHPHQRGSVIQRELGSDTLSCPSALRHGLRQDPDVMVIGELRDPESVAIGLTAAESGRTVLATVDGSSVVAAIERLIAAFPVERRVYVFSRLSSVLLGITNQVLAPRSGGRERAAAFEVLVGTPEVCELIREQRLDQMRSQMQEGRQHGMQTLEQALAELVRADQVTAEVALARAGYPQELRQILAGG